MVSSTGAGPKDKILVEKMKQTLDFKWHDIDWNKCFSKVAQLQNRIAVEYMAGDYKLVQKLQNALVNSFQRRAIAVRKVTFVNKGKVTPGVDNLVVLTPEQRRKLVLDLQQHREIKPSPVRRVWISKDGTPVKPDYSNGRPLGIPCIYDRAAQAVWRLALQPIAECVRDRNSYRYRPHRSIHDQAQAIFLRSQHRYRLTEVLEADIKGFFDNIAHDWILNNIPMDRKVLKGWLEAGYVHNFQIHETESGVPQGGVISPVIANMVLDGLEEMVQKAAKRRDPRSTYKNVMTVRYADDFVVLGRTQDILKVVTPAIEEFLQKRGLSLNPKKTVTTSLRNGFDFVGFNFKLYPHLRKPLGFMLLVKPSRKSIQKFKDKVKRAFCGRHAEGSAYDLIYKLNPILKGWRNHRSHVVSKRLFAKLEWYIWHKCLNWAKKKHPTLGVKEVLKKYFKTHEGRVLCFYGNKEGKELYLFLLTKVPIKRQKLVRDKNPYLLENAEYYKKRTRRAAFAGLPKMRYQLLKHRKGVCPVCEQLINPQYERYEVHHILRKKKGGKNKLKNLVALHRECHRQVTYTKNPVLIARFQRKGLLRA